MADTYAKLLGLADKPLPQSEVKQVNLEPNQQTSKVAKKQTSKPAKKQINKEVNAQASKRANQQRSNIPLSTKEKKKYGTYLREDSILAIQVHAVQTKRKDHEVLQEAVDAYFLNKSK